MKSTYFFAGLLLAGIGWWVFWPGQKNMNREGEKTPVVSSRNQDAGTLERARGGRGDPHSYRDLERLPIKQLKEELEEIHEGGGLQKPDEFAEGLLLALAHKDYREALLWTHGLFEESWKWSRCYEIMGSEWGANEPDGLILFLDDIANDRLGESEQKLSKLIDPGSDYLRLLPTWIVDQDPRQAFQLAHLTDVRARNDQIDLIERLQGPKDFAAALSAWKEPGPGFTGELRKRIEKGISRFPAEQYFYVRGVIGKWKEFDRESFLKSEYASWDASGSQ